MLKGAQGASKRTTKTPKMVKVGGKRVKSKAKVSTPRTGKGNC